MALRRWLLVTLSALLGGCGRTQPAPTTPDAPPAAPGALRFLALGDSYTIGESVDPAQRWPVQLAAALRKQGVNIGDPTIIARTGWTTADLSAAMDAADLHGPYDLVGLLIGVNNQYQGRSIDEYKREFADLLNRSITLAGNRPGRVFVLSIPDWGVTPFAKASGADPAAVGKEIDAFNAINHAIATAAGVAYVDITPVSRQYRDFIAGDGLHPDGRMYGKWVEVALPAVETAIARIFQ